VPCPAGVATIDRQHEGLGQTARAGVAAAWLKSRRRIVSDGIRVRPGGERDATRPDPVHRDVACSGAGRDLHAAESDPAGRVAGHRRTGRDRDTAWAWRHRHLCKGKRGQLNENRECCRANKRDMISAPGLAATIQSFNSRIAAGRLPWFWPTIAAALATKHHWLIIACDARGTDLDLTMKRRHPDASVRVALRARAMSALQGPRLSTCHRPNV
jgi:hypothetical protein